MNFDDNNVLDDKGQPENTKANAYKVDDAENLSEKKLTNFLSSDDDMNPVKEGTGAGGHNFGKNNLTPAGNDHNNPSQYAGNTNPYFDRKEPSEEHPEDSNFTAKGQDGEPDYDKTQPRLSVDADEPKPEKVERGDGENDRPHKIEPYTEGTVDNDETNIPGPDELPDQQKVGEDVDEDTYDKDHFES